MRNYLYYREGASYPIDRFFRPDKTYPEYMFPNSGISETPNDVYDMIRDMFIRMELDKKNMGTREWNPLAEYISPGDTVLIKPNWVKHENEAVKGKGGLDCLVTNTAVIRCVIDYTLLALKGTGKVIVADAPVQACDLEKLQKKNGISAIKEFYEKEKIQIEFEDLRNFKSCRKGENVVTVPVSPKYEGETVNLGKHSYFYNHGKNRKLRITNYDYHSVNKHHTGSVQEYRISRACLEADVIINLPKPKTHRKAGYTGALKNMVGINAEKDYLPHHTKGSYQAKEGDEYYSDSKVSKIVSDMNDIADILDKNSRYFLSRLLKRAVYFMTKDKVNREKYSEGSWWGNDTLWRTVLDLNTIVFYADKNGKLKNDIQRKVITLGDMIISGEKEGPMLPSPKRTYSVLFSDNSVMFDEIVVRFMGFMPEKFPLLEKAEKNKKLCLQKMERFWVYSNRRDWNREIEDFTSGYYFEPTDGWKGYI